MSLIGLDRRWPVVLSLVECAIAVFLICVLHVPHANLANYVCDHDAKVVACEAPASSQVNGICWFASSHWSQTSVSAPQVI
ncbi:hypothetical protein BJY52DRAFT_420050 [Lactarius psammicola]|nr:hypothetical protein BJY52DRAFT_420050 [Lactarius psammicola]